MLTHVIGWILWYTANSMSAFAKMPRFTPLEWWQLCYNYLSLVIIFYASCWVMQRFFGRFSIVRYRSFSGIKKIRYLLKSETLLVLLVLVAYLGISLLLDNLFFGYAHQEYLLQLERRFTRVSTYVVTATGYAYYKWYILKLEKRNLSTKLRLNTMHQHYTILKTLHENISKEQRLN